MAGELGSNHSGRPSAARTLREIRLERGFSIREFAQVSGVSKGTVSLVERGRLIPTEAEQDAFERTLGVRFDCRTMLVERAA